MLSYFIPVYWDRKNKVAILCQCLHICATMPYPYVYYDTMQEGKGATRVPRYTPQVGMAMFGLQQVQLYWERAMDTKVGNLVSSPSLALKVSSRVQQRHAACRPLIGDLSGKLVNLGWNSP